MAGEIYKSRPLPNLEANVFCLEKDSMALEATTIQLVVYAEELLQRILTANSRKIS